jgi:hypothetical protein
VKSGNIKSEIPFPKSITRTKRAGGVAQTVEHLPNKCKAMDSNPNTEKMKNNHHNKKQTTKPY